MCVYPYFKLTICQSNKRLTTLTPFPIFQTGIPPKRPAAISIWCKCSYQGLLTASHTVLFICLKFYKCLVFSSSFPFWCLSRLQYLYINFMIGPVGMFFTPALSSEYCQSLWYCLRVLFVRTRIDQEKTPYSMWWFGTQHRLLYLK